MRGTQKLFRSTVASALVVTLLFLAPTIARAVTTNLSDGGTINLATAIDNNLSVQVGDKVFGDFSWVPSGTYTSDVDLVAANVNVRAVVNPNDIGFRLEFQLPLTAGDQDNKDVAFEYTAAVTNSSNLISDIHLSVNGGDIGDGFWAVSETTDAGGFGYQTIGYLDANSFGPTDSVTNLDYAVAKLWITKDLTAMGASDGSDNSHWISSIDQTFSQVPEPSTALLAGLGLLGVIAVGLKRKS